MIKETTISWGHISLIETFIKANGLEVSCSKHSVDMEVYPFITLEYDERSDTGDTIMYMSVRHLGFENMLCDYLLKCGVPRNRISDGRTVEKRDMKQLDRDWDEYRTNTLGFR